MLTYAPGSFTKNFGWNRDPPGLKKLYTAIRAGFRGVAEPVARENFRNFCGIADPNRQLLPLNFFLHNTIISRENYVTNDELVRHAVNNPYSTVFDRGLSRCPRFVYMYWMRWVDRLIISGRRELAARDLVAFRSQSCGDAIS